MSSLFCTFMLAVSACLAHYGSDYNSRNLIERNLDEPIKMDGFELVECPVCQSSENWRYREESCEVIGNKQYKRCYFGIYRNRACGNRFDCFRGVEEDCMINEEHDIRCKAGSNCNQLKKCSDPLSNLGAIDESQTKVMMILTPMRWPAKKH